MFLKKLRRLRPQTFTHEATQASPDTSRVEPIQSLDHDSHTPHPTPTPIKGRKRFTADLSELNSHPDLIACSGEWSVRSVKRGDDEGSLEIVLTHDGEHKVQTIIVVVSDTSLYPDEHSYFGYSQDGGNLESDVARVIDKLPRKTGHTLREVVEFFVTALSGDGLEDVTDDEESIGAMFDEDREWPDCPNPSQAPQLSLGHLKKDFIEVKAAGYNPGILWTGKNKLIISVSLPVSDLFQHILPHALLAWDRNFLQPGSNLTLLISGFSDVYPVLLQDGTLSPSVMRTGSTLKFKVGFIQHYKPSRSSATAAFCEFFLRNVGKRPADTSDDTVEADMLDIVDDPDPDVFRKMSLSTSLESILNQHFLRLLQLRRRFNLGWAGAEELLWQMDMTQEDSDTTFKQKREEVKKAELHEKSLAESNNLLSDSIDASSSDMNILKISFAFMLRRLALSSRHCVVCHRKLWECEALRPYVCTSSLCVFQYYSLNLGPSIEQEIITNVGAVDLLVSLAYVAAVEGVLDEPLPRGMGLRVRPPANSGVPADADGLCQLDWLSLGDTRKAIAELLASLPPVCTIEPIAEMKNYLQRQLSAGNTRAQLKDVHADVLPAAWSIMRWCVASCTAYIEEITKPEDRLRNLGRYRQFRFLVGAPDKEKKFLQALPKGDHPAMFAFHGSPLRNWHSIIRHGLWTKTILHGRSMGNGVYFSQDAAVSLTGYATPSSTVWHNSTMKPTACCTLAEIVNRPKDFVHNQPPYFVVDKTDWIMCRYLLVRTATMANPMAVVSSLGTVDYPVEEQDEPKLGSYLLQPRSTWTRLGARQVDIPRASDQLDRLVRACVLGRKDITLDAEDRAIFDGQMQDEPGNSGVKESSPAIGHAPPRAGRVWEPDDKWILRNAQELLPPPTESSLTASATLRREFKGTILEQNMAVDRNDLATLGWYLPPQHNEDNLYQWLVELHSFDPELPIAKDMESEGVSSIAMEIRFPSSFPHAPPFFRVIRPRFRRYMEGGGGHVTVGGSICMDLLTSDGWLPSYSVSAVLLQIKLAMSSTTPYFARLDKDWDRAYTPSEALNGYIRAAGIHNWKIKNEAEIRKLVTAT